MSRSAGQLCAGPMMWMAGEQPEVQVRGAGQGLTVERKAEPAAYWCVNLW